MHGAYIYTVSGAANIHTISRRRRRDGSFLIFKNKRTQF
jgi:hypothetical protein